MFIGADASRENFRNIRIGNGREAPVNSTGSIGGPFRIHFAQRVHKGKDSVLIVFQDRTKVPWLNSAEGHRRPIGKTEGKDCRRNIGAKGHQPGTPADLDAGVDELLGEGGPRLVGAHEDVEVLLLVVLGNHLGRLRIGRRPDDRGKTRCRTVDELDAALAHDRVVSSPQPDPASLDITIFTG